MQHRISVGAIIERNQSLMLVRHTLDGRYDFWVSPGGGVKASESLEEAAIREAREECGLGVVPRKLLYIEELINPDCRHVKFWFEAQAVGGTVSASHPEAVAEHITEAAWIKRAELEGLTLFPPVLKTRYWEDKAKGFLQPVRLPLREMEFW